MLITTVEYESRGKVVIRIENNFKVLKTFTFAPKYAEFKFNDYNDYAYYTDENLYGDWMLVYPFPIYSKLDNRSGTGKFKDIDEMIDYVNRWRR